MKVYVILKDRCNDRDYEDSIYEFDKYVCVSASWANAIQFIEYKTDKESYYYINPEWDDTEYMMYFELMPYKREMAATLEDEPDCHFSTTRVASVWYEDDLYGSMQEQYYIRVAEI